MCAKWGREIVAAKVGVDGSCTGGWCQRCRIVPSYSGLFSAQGCCTCWGQKTSPVHVFFCHNELYYPHNNWKMTSTAISGSRKDHFAIEPDCTLVVKWILWVLCAVFHGWMQPPVARWDRGPWERAIIDASCWPGCANCTPSPSNAGAISVKVGSSSQCTGDNHYQCSTSLPIQSNITSESSLSLTK